MKTIWHVGWLTVLCLGGAVLPVCAQEEQGKITLNFQNLDVRAALYALADEAGKDMIVGDAVKGQISIKLQDVPWEQALSLILQARGLEQQRIGKVRYISARDELLGQEKQRYEAGQQRKMLIAPQMQAFALRHRQAEEMRKILEQGRLLSEKGSMLVDPHSNTLFVHDTPENGQKIQQLLELTDTPRQQVMIEAKIVEANDHFSRELGSKLNFARLPTRTSQASSHDKGNGRPRPGLWQPYSPDSRSLPSGVDLPVATSFGSIAALFKASAGTLISLELQAMQAEGQGKLVSTPRLLTADRHEATIEEGNEMPVPRMSSRGTTAVDFKKTALSLKVKPTIATDGQSLWLEIEINKDSPNYRQVNLTPSIDTKRIRTAVQVENGGTVVLGGIYVDEQHAMNSQVPWLGDIPLLGWLFRHNTKKHSRRELLVFITPQIVSQS
ncbi:MULTISPECIES: type IV pilus secretin PilQ [unclassified Paludibacterium]|uniref:type IV pilus secretin PilQ n=1 Tax=unclassified Paludibacterium TaxID=2618429 RepID=UPI001C03B16C|nr:type IV pilus secretin PilQ [Paludibacterium sp. B53371]BEV73164.1 hypothetical protein THUN1379_26460 [Paludibacterium sp. THUN1379]